MTRRSSPLSHTSADPGQSRFNQEIGEGLRRVLSAPLSSYRTVEVTVTTSPTRVTHNLGRPRTGWIIVDRDANESVWRVDPPSGETEVSSSHFYLQSTGSVSVTVLVF